MVPTPPEPAPEMDRNSLQPQAPSAIRMTSTTMLVLGWTSLAIGTAALGVYVGKEVRKWYRFKKRTPYDFYSKAGNQAAAEFGMGI